MSKPYNQHLRALLEQHERDAAAIGKVARKDFTDYSLVGHVRSILGLGMTSGSEAVLDENERIREISGDAPDGCWVSLSRLSQRDLSAGTPGAGGHTTAAKHDGGLIEALRPASAVIGAGATLVSGIKQGNLVLPRVTTSVAPGWVGEGIDASESQQSFDQVIIQPETVTVYVDVTRNLLMNSSVNNGLEDALRRDIFNALMQKIDYAAIAGVGAGNEPLGVLNDTNVPVVAAGTNGAVPSWAMLADLEYAVTNQVDDVRVGFVTNPKVRRKLRNTARGSGLDYIWTDNDRIMGRNARVSDSIPSNLTKGTSSGICSAIVAGNWVDCIVAFWGPAALDIIVDRYKFGKEGIVRIVARADIGIGLRHTDSFAVCKDVLTA